MSPILPGFSGDPKTMEMLSVLFDSLGSNNLYGGGNFRSNVFVSKIPPKYPVFVPNGDNWCSYHSAEKAWGFWTQIGSSWGWVLMESKEMMFPVEKDRRREVVSMCPVNTWATSSGLNFSCVPNHLFIHFSLPLALFLCFLPCLSLLSHGNFSGFLPWGQ